MEMNFLEYMSFKSIQIVRDSREAEGYFIGHLQIHIGVEFFKMQGCM